jgi:hypothetical protein
MAVDGFWIVRFTGAQVAGTGVVVFANGKVFGGETGFYYIGNYEADGNIFKARVMIRNFDTSIPSGFGVSGDYEMDVSTILKSEDMMTGTAMISGQPQHSIGIQLTKKASM